MTRKLGTIILFVALTVGAIWLFRPPPAAPIKVAAAPKIDTPKPAALKPAVIPQVAAPKAAPAAPKSSEPEPTPEKPSGDPQAELNTALSDIINLVQSGDLLTAFERYAPPEELAKMSPEEKSQMEQELSSGMAQPEAQQAVQMIVTVLQGMQTQTPTLNAAGDRATYQVSDPTGQDTQTHAFGFQKINGKWYVDPNTMNDM